jgi:glycosyltransferase involved in cell wall biosynthesis
MNILQISPTFVPSKFGGVKTVSFNISHFLAEQGHNVVVYTTDAEIGPNRLTLKDYSILLGKINVIYFKNLNNSLAFRYRIFLPIGFRAKIINEIQNFDIIHIHDYRSLLAIIACFYAKKYGIPYIIQPHGSLPRTSPKQYLKGIFDLIWGKSILINASKVIALTDAEREQILKIGVPQNKIKIIPNGIDLKQFSNLPTKGIFRSRYNISNEEKIVLFLGRIHRIKGIDLLISAYSELLEEFPHSRLVITGPDDGFLLELKEMIDSNNLEKNVVFTGPLFEFEKLSAYVDADVLVLPSRYETFPVTILEAMNCGTPVLLSNRCGISNLIQKNNAGLIFDFDKEQLKECIRKILIDNSLKSSITNKGKSFVEENYDWGAIISLLESLYLEILGDNRIKK